MMVKVTLPVPSAMKKCDDTRGTALTICYYEINELRRTPKTSDDPDEVVSLWGRNSFFISANGHRRGGQHGRQA